MATPDKNIATDNSVKAVAAAPVAPKANMTSTTPMPVKKAVSALPKVAAKAAAKRSAIVAKTPVKPPVKTAVKSKVKPAANPKAEKPAKAKKPKMVRDSFTIPKAEYTVLDDLKQRAGKLESAAKKSELLRAGVKALAAMSDAAFLAALKAVPAIKTGRPTKE